MVYIKACVQSSVFIRFESNNDDADADEQRQWVLWTSDSKAHNAIPV